MGNHDMFSIVAYRCRTAHLNRRVAVSRLQIKIKDEDKASIVLNLLRELPFVEIEGSVKKISGRVVGKGSGSLADLFGIWERRKITLKDIREKAWSRIC